MTKDELISIFYSNYNVNIDYNAIDEILFLMNEKCLRYESKIISNKGEFNHFIDKINSGEIKTYDIAGGGGGHLALKLLSLKYIKQPYAKVNCENWFQGYIPDLIFGSNDNVTVVECGDTNPTKILDYLQRKEVNKIVIISYPKEDNLIYQHIFSKGLDLEDYLHFKSKISLERIKKILKKR